MAKTTKILLSAFLFLAVFAAKSALAQEVKNGLTWYTDLNKVYEVSMKTKKPVFAFFTGSDWCGWCHRMQANVFDKPEFKAWAEKYVILLELDFPRAKKLPDELVQQNNSLQQAFKVQGFPTIWMFDLIKDQSTGKYNINAIGSCGYPQAEAGKEAISFLVNANQILSNRQKPQ